VVLCGDVGLFCRDVGLFCGDVGLFCGDLGLCGACVGFCYGDVVGFGYMLLQRVASCCGGFVREWGSAAQIQGSFAEIKGSFAQYIFAVCAASPYCCNVL